MLDMALKQTDINTGVAVSLTSRMLDMALKQTDINTRMAVSLNQLQSDVSPPTCRR